MRTHFGDYRVKMAAEEKKLVKMTSKIKIADTPVQPKATFLRKSAFLTTGNSSFRFDFNLTPDQLDTGNTTSSTAQQESTTDEKDAQHSNTASNTELDNSSKKFKFSFSDSEFKFNFDVNDSKS
ncbi:hypothetical protein MSG28_015649 [Choristoneura fumiferana]|uniref:Uncharacterized protein n=2 Tax=Choristoneura fumiferana TaxID=7141 RepID=A0ACC0KBH7_CHOFU|nr:hypothetical protein MSG28_015649 [Choristoneura fumiferana]